jgi:hypothetical protein
VADRFDEMARAFEPMMSHLTSEEALPPLAALLRKVHDEARLAVADDMDAYADGHAKNALSYADHEPAAREFTRRAEIARLLSSDIRQVVALDDRIRALKAGGK